jgi:hypothetical protein
MVDALDLSIRQIDCDSGAPHQILFPDKRKGCSAIQSVVEIKR